MKIRHGKLLSGMILAGLVLCSLCFMTCSDKNNEAPTGLAPAGGGHGPKIKWDLDARPFPEIPFPNDVATRLDSASPTGRRVNVSVEAPTNLERSLRGKIDQLTGFGIFGQINISFKQPIDLNVIIDRQQKNNDFNDDAILLLNLNPKSPNYGKATLLDAGKGNFPLQLEDNDNYFPYDPRGQDSNLFLETHDEDIYGNGVFDPNDMDTDFDGVFDRPNVFYHHAWQSKTNIDPADPLWRDYHNLVDFYERETNTLILRPVLPLEEESVYAVVVTKRLTGLSGPDGKADPVRSPFEYINHTQQTEELKPLKGLLRRYGLGMSDVAFCWKFTTGSITRDMVTIRRGLYGHGSLARLGQQFPADFDTLNNLQFVPGMPNPYMVKAADIINLLNLLITAGLGDALGISATDIAPLLASYDYADYFFFGTFKSPNFLVDRDGIAAKDYPADEDETFTLDAPSGDAVYGDGVVTFLCSVPKPNYRLEKVTKSSAGGDLDYAKVKTHVVHRLGNVFVDSVAGQINRNFVHFSSDAGSSTYAIQFGDTFGNFQLMDRSGTDQGSGNVSSDFTTIDTWLTINAAAWSGTFNKGTTGLIELEPYIDKVTGPFSQTYRVTFQSGADYTVADGNSVTQGAGTVGADFTTTDGFLTLEAGAFTGTPAAGDYFDIKTVAMRPPYPVVIEGHGYTSMKFEMLGFAGNLSKHGLAVCDLDAVGHGVGIPPDVKAIIDDVKNANCTPPITDPQWQQICGAIDPLLALLKGRARDLNNDGIEDSGGDFWTADTFHTRDIVRQTIVDQIQQIRILRSFHNGRLWKFDVNQNGIADDVAGDLNGDGEVDLGGWTNDYHTWGISLGGILSGFLAGIEPAITAAAPVSGGGGLLDIAARSTQGGVVEAVFIRLFGPIVIGQPAGPGQVLMRWLVPDVNNKGWVDIGITTQVRPGDKIIVRNLKTGESRWAFASADGNSSHFRVHIPADAKSAVEKRPLLGWPPNYVPGDTCRPLCDVPNPLKIGDPIVIEIYNGQHGDLKQKVDTWLQDSKWQGAWYVQGTPLVAPHEGFGHYRNTPDLRKFVGIAQTVMDPADPASYAVRYHAPADPATAPNSYYTFPGPLNFRDIEPDIQMGANVLVIPTIGDTNVPQNSGISNARCANMIELFKDDPRYGKTQNQVLLDNHVIEGVEKIESYFPLTISVAFLTYHILFDLDDLDEGGKCNYNNFNRCVNSPYQDYVCTLNGTTVPDQACGDGYNAPVLKDLTGAWAPLRLTVPTATGVAGMRMPYMQPTGQHGFDVPHPSKAFDIETYNINMIGRYFQTNGGQILDDTCMEKDNCVYIPPPPE